MSIDELEQLAVDQPEGMLGSVLGLGISLGVIDDALEEWQPGPEQAGYVEPLRANLAAVGGVVGRWYDGEISAADVAASLRPVRASSEQVLGDLRGELRRLGVSQEQIDAFMAEVMAGF
jgi:DNA-binding transcriptional MerR regulator